MYFWGNMDTQNKYHVVTVVRNNHMVVCVVCVCVCVSDSLPGNVGMVTGPGGYMGVPRCGGQLLVS